MTKPTIDQIAEAVNEKFPGAVLALEQHYDFPVFIIEKKYILPVFRFLYEDERFQFRFLTTLCGLHFPKTEKPFAMMYQLHSLVFNVRHPL